MTSESGYNPDEDPNLSEKQKEAVKKVLENEKTGKPDVVITVEKKEESDRDKEQDKFWSEAVSDIQTEYEKLGKSFDSSSIKSAEDIKNAFEDISNLKEQKNTPKGTPLTGRQLGYEEPTSDRDIQALKEGTRDIPLDLLEFNSEKEMKELLDAIANDTNDPRQKEAEKLRTKVMKATVNRGRAMELDSSLTEACHGKARWKIKKRSEDDD